MYYGGLLLSIIPNARHFSCGPYFSKRRFPAKHATDEYTQNILRIKRGDVASAKTVAVVMAAKIVELGLPYEMLVPVPNHYNHTENCIYSCRLDKPNTKAELLTQAVAREIRKAGKNSHSYPDVLARISKTKRFGRSGVPERQLAAENDFKISNYIIKNNNLIKDNTIILIDDITTSGSTTDVCQQLLLDNGVRQVYIVSAAETVV